MVGFIFSFSGPAAGTIMVERPECQQVDAGITSAISQREDKQVSSALLKRAMQATAASAKT